MSAEWKNKVQSELPRLGHRNWVLVVDKAFPLQSAGGIEVVNSNEELPKVLEFVLEEISAATHVRPVIYTDRELDALSDDFCPGISALREQIYYAIRNSVSEGGQSVLHEEVFEKIDRASKLFHVLVIKTETVLPYTSVFLELDCGYWSLEQEKQLRRKMKEV